MFLIGMPDTQAQENGKGHELSVAFQGLGIGSMPFSGSASWNDQPGLSLGFNVGYTYWKRQPGAMKLRHMRLPDRQFSQIGRAHV